ncbi:MAG: hypothetical protein JJW02_09280 [Pseudoalteromonas sp.]|nr:hypothetical protein [Pseudoalteromonas sp.]
MNAIVKKNIIIKPYNKSDKITDLKNLVLKKDPKSKGVFSCKVSIFDQSGTSFDSVPIVCHYTLRPETVNFIVFWDDHAINSEVHNLKAELSTAVDEFTITTDGMILIKEVEQGRLLYIHID